MLRVQVEYIPKGDRRRTRKIARIDIVNTADSPDSSTGNYAVKYVVERPNGDVQASTRRIEGFQRLRWNALGLLLQCLEALGQEGLEGEHDDRALGH